jgi:hypothetical protein
VTTTREAFEKFIRERPEAINPANDRPIELLRAFEAGVNFAIDRMLEAVRPTQETVALCDCKSECAGPDTTAKRCRAEEGKLETVPGLCKEPGCGRLLENGVCPAHGESL